MDSSAYQSPTARDGTVLRVFDNVPLSG